MSFHLNPRLLPLYVITIKGESMLPTFKENQKAIVLNLPLLAYKVNDCVVCRDPRTSELLIKRIQKILPNGSFYISGDNTEKSTDSRTFGPIQKRDIYGKILT